MPNAVDVAITAEGRNCWRKTWSKRIAFLVDGAAYFSALAGAVERARRSILMLGWDFDSRTRLRPEMDHPPLPDSFATFLRAVLDRTPGLQAHILGWDFAMIYALEREPLPLFKFGLRTHRNLNFRLDGNHPFGGSHHQKIVVIDDAVAFVGGLDITKRRWDTPDHRAEDPRRIDPGGIAYPPFHDVQVMVDGETARRLGDLARRRWLLATGDRLTPPGDYGDPWPPGVIADIENAFVAIARTEPYYLGRPEVREVETLFLDSIAAARHSIYIENQYFTSVQIAEALAQRLNEEKGPEIVLVTPRESTGLLEETTMGVLRARLLEGLRKKDRYDRLRVFYPVVPDLRRDQCVNVHSKVMVVDDRLVRVGSANMSNRSMGLDTECDVAVEAPDDQGVRTPIVRFRDRLLAEHLGVPVSEVEKAMEIKRSLVEVAEMLRGRKRTLEVLETNVPEWLDGFVPDGVLLDPERPIESERLFTQILAGEEERTSHPFVKAGIFLSALLLLAVLWHYGPLREWFELNRVEEFIASFRTSLMAPLIVVGAFAVAGLLVVPLILMIVATAFAFDPLPAFFYALSGALASSVIGFALGRFLGRDAVRRFAGVRLNRLSRRLAHSGILAIVLVRLIPVLPFTVVNLVAGASYVKFKEFLVGTAIGLCPGILAITMFEKGLENAVRRPGVGSATILAAIIIITFVASRVLKARTAASE